MTQAIATTILPAPRPAAAPAVIYLPEIHSIHGDYFPELRTGDTTKATIVADIASAEHDKIIRVIAVDLASGTSYDASAEIADLVLDVVLAECDGIPAACEDFLERHLGIHNVRQAEYEYQHAA